MASKPLIALDHVGHSFDDGRIVALKDVSLTIQRRRLGRHCRRERKRQVDADPPHVRHQDPNRGRVLWKGEPVSDAQAWTDLRRSEIGIVFQEFNLFPTLTARENIEVAMFGTGLGSRERRRRAEAALETVGLSDARHASAARALRRRAPARGHRAQHHQQSDAHSRRRADRQSRQRQRGGDSRSPVRASSARGERRWSW